MAGVHEVSGFLFAVLKCRRGGPTLIHEYEGFKQYLEVGSEFESSSTFVGSLDDVLTADAVFSNDERDAAGIEIGWLIQTE